MKRSVRWLAWFLAIIGLFVIGCGVAARFVPLITVGMVLATVGSWNLVNTSIHGMMLDGMAMILTGLLGGLVWLWIDHARSTSAGKWIFTGVVQLWWGVQRLATWNTARFTRNDREAIARLEALIRDLSKRKAKSDPSVVEFWTGRWRPHRNRVGLYAEGSIALLDHQAVRLEKRGDIWIETRGTFWLGRSVKVRVQMSDLELMGWMPTAQFERFERWKLGLSQARKVA
jgi:hypothetical protein